MNIRRSRQTVFCFRSYGDILNMQYTRSACAYCSFVWTKEPKATATRKSRGRTLGGLKRAPGAVLQAKRPRFPDGRAGNNLLGKGFGRGIRNTSCSCFGPSVALLRLRPASPISARREMHVSPVFHMKIGGYRTSSSSQPVTQNLFYCIGPHENPPWYWPALPLKEQCMFFLTPKKLLPGILFLLIFINNTLFS